ncbi:MAG: cytochrome c biogenesis protein CcsA [Vicinamibacterales bacterium]
MRTANRLVPFLLVIGALMFIRAPFMIDAAPYESTMGLVQKIFYYHVPSAVFALLSAFVCGAASGVFLWRRTPTADRIALAAAELVVVFGAVTLITGPLWARKAWGIWWDWEPRLTLTFVLWMSFAGLLMLRRFGGPGSEVMAAAVGLFGAVLAPFVYWSVNLWRTLHPTTNVVMTLQGDMRTVFFWCLVAFLFLYVALLLTRVRVEAEAAALEEAYAALED